MYIKSIYCVCMYVDKVTFLLLEKNNTYTTPRFNLHVW